MPFQSEAQARLMRAVAHGFKPDRIKGPTQQVAREFVNADKRAKKPKKKAFGGFTSTNSGFGGKLRTADRVLRDANSRLQGMPGKVKKEIQMGGRRR